MIGTTLGNYEIREPLGAGGMGEVYRAHDTNLKRDVAVKVLPQELSGDADRLARLEREAYLLASLNHPNIATIFGLDEIDGTRFLVLELIEGESLQQRLERGPLPIEEALGICGQVARALEVAHEADIVHRDLKPANVLITCDDHVKVLDFGIAKTLGPTDDNDPEARATALTAAGTLVGTAPYMSPEQVRGEAIDKRADVWAFGCMLFETLAGTGPFTRETVADTLAAIVGEEPNWDLLPPEVSAATRMLMHRCLQKNPKVRQRDIGDAWVEINQSRSLPGGVPMSMPPTLAARASGLRRGGAAVLAAGALAIGAFAGSWLGPEPSPLPRVPLYLDFDLPEETALPTAAGPTIAISPDGSRIAMVLNGPSGPQLYLRRLDEPGEPQPVRGSEHAAYPFFSPDGTWLAFDTANGGIAAVSLEGEDSQTLCRACRRGAWGDDNSIFVQATGEDAGSFWARIAEPGAPMEMLPPASLDGERLWPNRVDVLPGSRAVLFQEENAVYAYSLDTQKVVVVERNEATDPYYAGGYVLFPRDNTLYAVPFDVDTLSVGEPIVAQLGVLTEPGGAMHAAVSRDSGILVFAPGRTVTGFRLGWVDRSGVFTEMASDEDHIGAYPRVSPDGRRIALGMASDPDAGIWLFDESTGALDRFHLVDHVRVSNLNHPVWSRDGSSLTYREVRNTVGDDGETRREQVIARKQIGGSRDEETLRTVPYATAHSWVPADWTPDDQRLVYRVATQSPRLLFAPPGAQVHDAQLFEDTLDNDAYTLSHDGKWLAYVSRRLGADSVYVRPFPDGEEIKVADGNEPRWGPDDRELFYIAGNRLMSAQVRVTDGDFGVAGHEDLFGVIDYPPRRGVRARYDVHPDGNRFVVVRPNSVDEARVVRVVVNWFDEIARLTSEGR